MEPEGSLGGKPAVGSSAAADGGVDVNAVIRTGAQQYLDLNVVAGDDVEGGGLHGFDLNEGVNYILHEGSSAAKRKLIELNQDAAMNEEKGEVQTVKRVKWLDLNVELKEDAREEKEKERERRRWRRLPVEGDKGKAVLEETPPPLQVAEPPHALRMPPSRRANAVVGGGRNNGGGVLPFSAYDYGMHAAAPPPSASLDLRGASLFDFLPIYGFLRSFSSLLFLSPFEVDEFVICNHPTSLFDSVHLPLLRAIRPYLRRLSGEGSASASSCLRSESCGEESSFLVYRRDDLPAVVASLLSSLLLHEKTISAVCRHWNLPHGESHHRLEIPQRPTAITEIAEAENCNIIPTSAIGDGGASSSASQEIPLGTRYVNLYEFAFVASSFWEELAFDKSDDDARTADQIMAR